jgi:ATP-dependent phosphoenolpyruvate carboxykinase
MFSRLGNRLATRTSVWGRRAFATSSAQELGLDKQYGIQNKGIVHRNLTYPEIHEHEKKQGSGSPDMWSSFAANDTMAVDTGKYTGRSPTDKWIVKQAPSAENLWWGKVNQPMDAEVFDELFEKVQKFYQENVDDMYVLDAFCGANPNSTKKVRFVTEMAWQHHFVTNMFIRPDPIPDAASFVPEYTVINCCKVVDEKWKEHNLNSETVIAFNLEKKVAIILGSWYGGEMKKGIFSMMNYWLPLDNIMPMHCSANKGKNGDTALFFGLSGTGKTTLSADPNRLLIGDDEHGWDSDGIFNFEGGCYAKTIDLSRENEPEIYDAIKPGALLENVSFNEDMTPDYYNTEKTQNGRVSYPIEHIDNHEPTLAGGHPNAMIFLTCDAYGVLPPVAKLSSEQAMYHFLSGYTAKVAGTERGITEPEATFSACFGAAFLTLHPTDYAKLLGEKLDEHKTHAYLVNTGWSGGAYGTGERMKISQTRACIDAILDGSVEKSEFVTDPMFQFQVPTSLPGVPSDVLGVKDTWADQGAYEATRKKLASLFVGNFEKYKGGTEVDYSAYGPQV